MLVLVAGIAAVVLPYSRASIEAEVPPQQQYLFYTMFVLCLTGLLGITITGDAFNIFVFLEIRVAVDLRAHRARPGPARAGRRLPVPDHGHDRRHFIVIGIGLLYLMTGTLNLADHGRRIGVVQHPRRCWRRWPS